MEEINAHFEEKFPLKHRKEANVVERDGKQVYICKVDGGKEQIGNDEDVKLFLEYKELWMRLEEPRFYE